jgi:hypothetical protein
MTRAGYRRCDDSVADGEGIRAGVQDDAGRERVSGLVAEPGQVTCVRGRDGGGGLDFDADQLTAGRLDKQIHFPAPLLFAQVVQARVVAARGEFRAQLRGDERIKEATQHVGAVQDGVPAESEHGRHERRVDQVALGGFDEPLDPVGEPGGDQVQDEHLLEERLVSLGGLGVDSRGGPQR